MTRLKNWAKLFEVTFLSIGTKPVKTRENSLCKLKESPIIYFQILRGNKNKPIINELEENATSQPMEKKTVHIFKAGEILKSNYLSWNKKKCETRGLTDGGECFHAIFAGEFH